MSGSDKHSGSGLSSYHGGGGPGGVNGAGHGSDCESDDGEEGDYTVYECPGLAPVSIISWKIDKINMQLLKPVSLNYFQNCQAGI